MKEQTAQFSSATSAGKTHRRGLLALAALVAISMLNAPALGKPSEPAPALPFFETSSPTLRLDDTIGRIEATREVPGQSFAGGGYGYCRFVLWC